MLLTVMGYGKLAICPGSFGSDFDFFPVFDLNSDNQGRGQDTDNYGAVCWRRINLTATTISRVNFQVVLRLLYLNLLDSSTTSKYLIYFIIESASMSSLRSYSTWKGAQDYPRNTCSSLPEDIEHP
jgi:hypothetical protein